MLSLTDTVDRLYQGNNLEDRTEVYRGVTVSFGNYQKFTGGGSGISFRTSLTSFLAPYGKGPSESEKKVREDFRPRETIHKGPDMTIEASEDEYKGEPIRPHGPQNIAKTYDFGRLLHDQSLSGFGISERFDFAGVGGSAPHLNQDIVSTLTKDWAKEAIQESIKLMNSGSSRKNPDGFKGLGAAHLRYLFGDGNDEDSNK